METIRRRTTKDTDMPMYVLLPVASHVTENDTDNSPRLNATHIMADITLTIVLSQNSVSRSTDIIYPYLNYSCFLINHIFMVDDQQKLIVMILTNSLYRATTWMLT